MGFQGNIMLGCNGKGISYSYERVVTLGQVSAKDTSISVQILTTERSVIGGCYYPRSASSAIWLF